MGLFDFAKGIGNKIFGDDDDASDKLKEHIEQDNPGVEGLEIVMDGDTAILKGEASSPSAMEKAILMAGNALGVSNVEAGELSYPPAPEGTAETQYYEVQKGDSLWKIAKEVYGDGNKHTLVFEANREVIKDPDLIFPGQKLRIPAEA